MLRGEHRTPEELKDHKVLVHEYSSTGGGHTARSLDPILQAVKDKDGALKKGDCVVLLAPPRWPHDDDGQKVNKLHDYKKLLEDAGLKVIVKQSNKTVTGHYKADGASNNAKMLLDFVYKPRESQMPVERSDQAIAKDANNGGRPAFPPPGLGNSAQKVLSDVVSAAGKDNVIVLGDMAPYLQKAAQKLDIKTRVELGNHQGLLTGEGRAYLDDKKLSLAYLHKASGSGYNTKLALVDFSDKINVVQNLKATFAAFGINEKTTKEEARTLVANHLLETAKRKSLDQPLKGLAAKEPGILVGTDVNSDATKVKKMVYLYVNEYTADLVEKIREELAQGKHADTIFTVCNAGSINAERGRAIDTMKEALKEAKQRNQDAPSVESKAKVDELEKDLKKAQAKDNILMASYAAGADGICSAGFGTTSEYFYLASHGSDARLVVAPVENQHEQEANAAALQKALSGKVRNTNNRPVEERERSTNPLADQLFKMLEDPERDRAQEDRKALGDLVRAAAVETTGPKEAAKLLGDSESSAAAQEAMNAINELAATNAPKQHRRLLKLVVPMIDELSRDPDTQTAQVQAASKHDPHLQDLTELKGILKGLAEGSRDAGDRAFISAMHLDQDTEIDKSTRDLAAGLLAKLNEASGDAETKEAKAKLAKDALEHIATTMVMLGW